jgi:hypothetical protein
LLHVRRRDFDESQTVPIALGADIVKAASRIWRKASYENWLPDFVTNLAVQPIAAASSISPW